MQCATVKIQSDNEQGYIVINEGDFDKKTMKLFKESNPVADKPPVVNDAVAISAPEVNQPETGTGE